MKKALIFGVSGQDGAYLAKLLLSKGYTVYGTSRDAQVSSFRNLEYLGIQQQVQLESAALNDFRSVLQVLKKTRFHREVPMRWRRRQLFGRWRIIGRLMVCLLVRGYYSLAVAERLPKQ